MNIQKGSFSSIEQLQDRYLTPAKKSKKREFGSILSGHPESETGNGRGSRRT